MDVRIIYALVKQFVSFCCIIVKSQCCLYYIFQETINFVSFSKDVRRMVCACQRKYIDFSQSIRSIRKNTTIE